MAALSVQYFRGGATNLKFSLLHNVSSDSLILVLAATPPATTKWCFLSELTSRSSMKNFIAFRERSFSTSQTASWKLAAIFALSVSVLLEALYARDTAVFNPANEKSAWLLPINGLGKSTAFASPLFARRSTFGPPGKPSPITFAVLSNASPAASSNVLPILL